ncbi:MAG: efflux RND transporter periplasmic adaptor subunit [Bryobacterales bacterium]|nr:efflux RND transporter periplasmic adaptor subunit [Bryobacterales bacterium]
MSDPHKKLTSAFPAVLCLTGVFPLISSGCSKATTQQRAAAPLEVEVVRVEQKDVPVYREWIGTMDGTVNAEIKAQVTGYLRSRDYTEGSFVRKGQVLFQIDPRPLQAALDQARAALNEAEGQVAQSKGQLLQANAQLLQSEANQGKAQLDVNRYTPLAQQRAVTVQDLDNAIQANLAAKAQVEAAKAQVETAKSVIMANEAAVGAAKAAVATAELNLGFTKIVSPIDGIAGIATAQVGDLVSPGSASLTTVSDVDPIRVYFSVSEQEYLEYRRRYPEAIERQAREQQIQYQLVLADGTVYPQTGHFLLADRQVNLQTGTIRIAAVFPNPGNTLRPGQFGRIRDITQITRNALLAPQRAVTELQGGYLVAVVGPGNKVSIQPVKVGEDVGAMTIITEGLKAGETVIVEGTQRVRPGMVVNPKPFAGSFTSPAAAEER